jgi:type IV pilus assembly protein PilM
MRILGIDLGSCSIKVVELDSGFGRFEIHDYHEIPLESEYTPIETVGTWIKNRPRSPDRLVIALNSQESTFRNLQLPTRDKKAIQASVGYELEDELPFAVEQSVYEFVILSQTKAGSQVHITATLKDQIRTSLNPWMNVQIDPDIITSEAWAYRTMLNQVLNPSEQEGPVLLIQMGHRRSTFYLHWHGAPALIRDFDWGGQDLTLAISQKLSIPIEKAEETKIHQGMIQVDGQNSALTPEQLEVSDCLKAATEALLNELRIVQLTSRNHTRKSIQKIYLAGGTSLLPGLENWIEQKFEIPTEKILGLSATAASGVAYSEQTDSKFLLAASLAFCLVGQARNALINFRKGEFAKVSIVQKIDFQVLKRPLLALAAIGASLVLSLSIQSIVYRSRIEKTNTQLEKSVKSFFGQVSSSALRGYLADPKKLKTAVNKELGKQRELSRLFGPNPRSPIAFLNQISIAIPKDLVVDLSKLEVGMARTDSYTKADSPISSSLVFSVSSPQAAEKLASILSRKISPLQRGNTEEYSLPNSDLKKWKLSLSGNPTEESYGK